MEFLAFDVFPVEGGDLNKNQSYLFLGVGLVDDFEDGGTDLGSDVAQAAIGLQGLNNEVL